MSVITAAIYWIWSTTPRKVEPLQASSPASIDNHDAPEAAGPVRVEELTPQRVKSEIIDRLSAKMRDAGYEPERIEALGDRFSEFVTVQGRGSWEDYKALLRKWGGKLKHELVEPQYQAAMEDDRRRQWVTTDKLSAMMEYRFGTLTIVAYDRTKPGSSLIPAILPRGMTANEGFCAAEFPSAPAVIRRGESDVIRLDCKSKDRSGQEVGWYWFFVWSETDRAWLPAHVVTMVPQGYPATWPHF